MKELIFRATCFLAGIVLLGVAAHATIVAGHGYDAPHSKVILGIALGVATGAIAVGSAWRAGNRWIAVGLIVALVAGELGGMIMTAERIIATREKAQAPLREAQRAKVKAEVRVADALDRLNSFPAASDRIEAALAAQRRADQAVTESAAKRGCRKNCRALLEQKVQLAQAEVVAARAEHKSKRNRLEAELNSARAALNDLPDIASATPLADRLGVPSWAIDLTAAMIMSLAVNGLACFLLALAGHYHGPQSAQAVNSAPPASEPIRMVSEPPKTKRAATKRASEVKAIAPPPEPVQVATPPNIEQVDRFAFEELRPDPEGIVRLRDARDRYKSWCESSRETPLSDEQFVDMFAKLVQSARLEVFDNKDPKIKGIAFAEAA